VIMEQTDMVLATMSRLQEMGVRIHIDDFGTGYSSLSYLHSFPVDALKIDRSFIAKMSAADENQEIVKTIIALAQNLNLKVIAEGVEQNHQLAAISGLACQYGQGFIFSKPLPAEILESWIGTARKAAS
jgi:EAL domain-containing protein (putative c-di-GMP-specific phosphodiesterase class I)